VIDRERKNRTDYRRFLQKLTDVGLSPFSSSTNFQLSTSERDTMRVKRSPLLPTGCEHPASGVEQAETNDDAAIAMLTFTGVVIFITICLLLLLFIFLLRTERCRRWIGNLFPRIFHTEDCRDYKHTEKRIEERYVTLEYWLVTKPVHFHDEKCAHILSKFVNSSKVPPKHVESTEAFPADDISCYSQEGAECSICMSKFSPNQIASWSMNMACQHVFHHECIKVSLKRNTSAMCSRN
jgi:hypothetical protein